MSDAEENTASKFVRYAKIVDTKEEAWMFCMDKVDEFKTPNMDIHAIWVKDVEASDEDFEEKYEVTVYGDVEE